VRAFNRRLLSLGSFLRISVPCYWEEIISFNLSLLALVLCLKRPLFEGTTTFWHDNLYWNLPVFHAFTERIISGEFPWWNPYSHGGEPLYPLLLQIRLIEPFTLFFLGLAKYFTTDLLSLFHWHRVFLVTFFCLGSVVLFRRYTSTALSRLLLPPLLFLSSITLVSLRADAAINHILWIPWMTHFFLKVFGEEEGGKARDLIAGTLCLGVSFQSYFFVLPCFMALFLFSTAVIRLKSRAFSRLYELRISLLVSLVILGIFSLPNLVTFLERADLLFTARLLPQNFQEMTKGLPYKSGAFEESSTVKLSYEAIRYGGATSSLWEYIQSWNPEGNGWYFGRREDVPFHYGDPSELLIFIGLFPLVLLLLGLTRTSGKDYFLWLSLFILSLFLSFGPKTPFYKVAYFCLPFLWPLRHTQFFALLTLISMLYFIIQGANCIQEKDSFSRRKLALLTLFLAAIFLPAFFFYADRHLLIMKLVLFLLPCLLSSLLWYRTEKPYFLVVMAFFIGLDLFFHLRRMHVLHSAAPSPYTVLQSSSHPQPFLWPSTREAFPWFPSLPYWGSQRPRYLGSFSRKSFAFSRVPRGKEPDETWWDALYVPRSYFNFVQTTPSKADLFQKLRIGRPLLYMEAQGKEIPLKPISASSHCLSVKTETALPSVLHWAEGYDRSWSVWRNGALDRIEKNGAFKMVRIPKGSSLIEFVYWPRAWVLSVVLFELVFVLGWILFFCYDSLRGKPDPLF
jgi:hypothetical protein